jgi:hypothetical protein
VAINVITTVVEAASNYDLVALADVKDDLAITGTELDSFLKRAITRASVAAANFCNRVFVAETVQDAVMPDRDAFPYQVPGGMKKLQLSRWPVISITSVVEYTTTLVSGTDYTLDAKVGQLTRLDLSSTFPVEWSSLPVTAIYVAGYVTVPADVQDAVTRMVKSRVDGRKRDPFLKVDEVAGVGRQEFWVAAPGTAAAGKDVGDMPPDIAEMLERYRVPVVG